MRIKIILPLVAVLYWAGAAGWLTAGDARAWADNFDGNAIKAQPQVAAPNGASAAIAAADLHTNAPTTLGWPTTLTLTLVLTAPDPATQLALDLGDGSPPLTWTVDTAVLFTQTITHTYLAAEVWTATFTATTSVSQAVASGLVTVTNQPPVAVAGLSQAVLVSSPVTLDASASVDPDGHIPLSYTWSQVGGPGVPLANADLVTATFMAPATPATLVWALMVTDAYGLPAPLADVVTISVTDSAISLLTLLGPLTVEVGAPAAFSATAEGTNVVFDWAMGDGLGVFTATSDVLYTYTAPGDYTITLVARNSADTLSLTQTVQVVLANPVAHATAWPAAVPVGGAVALDGTASTAANPTRYPLQYIWQQTGGPAMTLSSPALSVTTFVAEQVGVLTFTLTVTDAQDAVDSTTVVVTVTPAKLYLPLVVRTDCATETEPNNSHAQANPLCPGQVMRGQLDGVALQSDRFKAYLQAGQYVVVTASVPMTGDIQLQLEGPDLLRITFTSTVQNGTLLVASHVTTTGMHYVRLVPTVNTTSTYSLRLRSDCKLTEVEPNNAFAQATPFCLGQSINGQIDPSLGSDRFKVDLQAGQPVAVSLWVANPAGVQLHLEGPAQDRIVFVSTASNNVLNLSSPITRTGTHYIRVVSAGASNVAYTLRMYPTVLASVSMMDLAPVEASWPASQPVGWVERKTWRRSAASFSRALSHAHV